MEEVGGVGASVLNLRFQRPAARHQRPHPLHDRGLFGEGRERDALPEVHGRRGAAKGRRGRASDPQGASRTRERSYIQ